MLQVIHGDVKSGWLLYWITLLIIFCIFSFIGEKKCLHVRKRMESTQDNNPVSSFSFFFPSPSSPPAVPSEKQFATFSLLVIILFKDVWDLHFQKDTADDVLNVLTASWGAQGGARRWELWAQTPPASSTSVSSGETHGCLWLWLSDGAPPALPELILPRSKCHR